MAIGEMEFAWMKSKGKSWSGWEMTLAYLGDSAEHKPVQGNLAKPERLSAAVVSLVRLKW